MKKITLLLLTVFLYLFSNAQVLPAEYQTDWSVVSTNKCGITQDYDSVNILNFGGNNIGAAANDAALTSAMASLNASSNLKIIYFPTGTYLFNSTVDLTDNIILQGEGATNTTLRFDFGGNGADLIRATGSMGTDSTAFIGAGNKNTNKIKVI